MHDVSQIIARMRDMVDGVKPNPEWPSDLRALLDEVKRLSETYKDSNGEVWSPPTAWAYAKVCEARTDWQTRATSAEALLREAGDVMRAWLMADGIGIGVDIKNAREACRSFLAKLSPAPKPREDTYPDRVSMEPWPHIGHAPGGSDAVE